LPLGDCYRTPSGAEVTVFVILLNLYLLQNLELQLYYNNNESTL